ncbi:MAG TPA: hypothetical protein VHG93_09550 [Longimicrobium sp.]|nr:hypothetical protein [Longimicrobium sp.]
MSRATGEMSRRARRSQPRLGRRWCLPPAILRETDETLEGSHILNEHREDLAGALWTAFRDVTLWTSVPPEKREGLFSENAFDKRMDLLRACRAESELEVHLIVLACVVDRPASMDPASVSAVCMSVSRWAEKRHAMGTAISFAQAAALAVPEDAGTAREVGRLALRWGRLPRSETWLRRAIGLARRAKDWGAYSESYVDLGALYRQRQQPERSHAYFVAAARAARRHGQLPVRGAALHGLFLLSMDSGDYEEAARYSRAALRAYGRGHSRLPGLLHDIAQLWIATGSYARAIPMLQRLLPERRAPADRALTLALLAHAAAATGERRLYEEGWSKAWALLDHAGTDERIVRTLLELARAAAALKDWLRVSLASTRQAEQAASARDGRLADEVARLAAVAAGAARP